MQRILLAVIVVFLDLEQPFAFLDRHPAVFKKKDKSSGIRTLERHL